MSLEQIGPQLKAARDGAGLSLSQIHERTKIPFNHLEAIEQGSFDDLPEPVYVSGFIKRYADCVGLDGQQLAVTYRNALNSSADKPEKSGFFFKTRKNNGTSPPPNAYYNRKPIELAPPNLIKMIPFYALWIVVILALIIYLVNRQESADLAQQDPSILALRQSTTRINNGVQPPSQPSAEKPNQAVTPEEADTTNNPTEQDNQTTTNNNQISVQAKKHVWVEVKAVSSGESLFTGFLEAGVSKTFSDKEGLRIRAGSGGNVSVTCAGKTQDLGLPGKIAEKTFMSPLNQTAQAKTEPADNSTSTANSTQSTSQSSKKTSIEKPVATKKAVAAPVHKQHLANQAGRTSGDEQGLTNKSIEVPYRY